jgi:two-component system chemotaxis response regulator CheY
MAAKKVLSVGQCGVDHPAIARVIRERFDADVVPADSADEAFAALRSGGYDLVLANRVFDMGGSGLEFIARLKADDRLKGVPVMLVSNYPDSQAEATALGALPGFGKAALRDPATLGKLADALGDD